jgi:hypothetical protein
VITAFVLIRVERLKVQETAEALLNRYSRHDLERIWGIGWDDEASAP